MYYNSFNRYIKERFDALVRRVPIDLGLGCPNCINNPPGCYFCNEQAFIAKFVDHTLTLEKQFYKAIKHFTKASQYIMYFQTGANTWGNPEQLEALYRQALCYPGVVGIAIATRPDCLNKEILTVLEKLNHETFVMIELGLQSAHNRTLALINRNHTIEHYHQAMAALTERNIYTATHLILGLPNESEADMYASVDTVVKSGSNAIKFHHLQIFKNTPLETMWQNNELTPLAAEAYPALMVRLLERIPWQIHIMRLLANTPSELLIAPQWHLDKNHMIAAINDEFKRRNSKQGSNAQQEAYHEHP